jgi:aminoglycoside/choline kinase family phosphotransferase
MSYKNEILLYAMQELYFKKFSENIDSISEIKPGASERKILRLSSKSYTCIGIYNENIKENIAFIEFQKTFRSAGLNVPEVYLISDDKKTYIEEDLGDISLFTYALQNPSGNMMHYYEDALKDLIKFQVEVKDDINYDFCCETPSFDLVQADFDINKFLTYYIAQFRIDIQEELKLETFHSIKEKLLLTPGDYFLFRDFQPRNIMMKNGSLYYIDFQSGRQGPLQYDLASFILSSSISLTDEEKEHLLSFYLENLKKYGIDTENFMDSFYYIALLRILQMLGNYGYIYNLRNDEKMLLKIPKALSSLGYIQKYINRPSVNRFISALRASTGTLKFN